MSKAETEKKENCRFCNPLFQTWCFIFYYVPNEKNESRLRIIRKSWKWNQKFQPVPSQPVISVGLNPIKRCFLGNLMRRVRVELQLPISSVLCFFRNTWKHVSTFAFAVFLLHFQDIIFVQLISLRATTYLRRGDIETHSPAKEKRFLWSAIVSDWKLL